jgi:hypothetical protein
MLCIKGLVNYTVFWKIIWILCETFQKLHFEISFFIFLKDNFQLVQFLYVKQQIICLTKKNVLYVQFLYVKS